MKPRRLPKLSIWVVVGGAVVLAAAVAVSALVGDAGPGKRFDWSLAAVFGTALGTTLLAVATGALAVLTWRDVTAAQELAQLTRDEAANTRQSLVLAQKQGETAQHALDAQTQPLLTNVHWGLADRGPTLRGDPVDAAAVTAVVMSRATHPAIVIEVPFRNIGNGAAHVRIVEFVTRAVSVTGMSPTPIVAPGELSVARLDLPEGRAEYDDVAATISAREDFSVVILYGDATGRPRGAVRFDLYHRDAPFPWYVRQVHWADDGDSVLNAPAFGSQPMG